MASEASKRETRGSIVRGTLAELKDRQLFDAVRARASPDVQKLMDDPPGSLDWIPSSLWESIVIHVGQIAGRETVREISYSLSRISGSVLIGPVIRATVRVFGASPLSVLQRVNTIIFLQHRGLEVAYEPETERSGFVVLHYPEPASEFLFAGWEGAYMLGKDVTGQPHFEVERFEIFDGGKAGRVHIRW